MIAVTIAGQTFECKTDTTHTIETNKTIMTKINFTEQHTNALQVAKRLITTYCEQYRASFAYGHCRALPEQIIEGRSKYNYIALNNGIINLYQNSPGAGWDVGTDITYNAELIFAVADLLQR